MGSPCWPASASSAASSPRAGAVGKLSFLALAEYDLARTEKVFWDPRLHWYNERLPKTGTRQSRSRASGRRSRSSRRSTRSRSQTRRRRPQGGHADVRARRREVLQLDDQAGRRLRLVPRDPRPATSTATSTTTAGWSSPTSTPIARPATPATSTTPSWRSGSSRSPAGTRTAAASGGRRSHLHKTSEPLAAEIYTGLRALPVHPRGDVPADGGEVPRLGEPVLLEHGEGALPAERHRCDGARLRRGDDDRRRPRALPAQAACRARAPRPSSSRRRA